MTVAHTGMYSVNTVTQCTHHDGCYVAYRHLLLGSQTILKICEAHSAVLSSYVSGKHAPSFFNLSAENFKIA